MDCRASESLVFGGLTDKTYESLKKRNFNCRQGTKIVDISHEDKGQMFDVFDTNGRFLDSFFVNTNGKIVKIEGDYIYSFETDEVELPYLMKYKIIK